MTGTGGGYYDRGAVQIPDPIKVTATDSSTWAAGSVTKTITATLTGTPWSSSVTYDFDFGDGTTQSSSSPVIQHTYTTAGTYRPTVTAVDGDHGSAGAQAAPFTLAGGNAYYPIAPTRVLDTRHGIGTATARVPADGGVKLKVAGVGGVPATGAVAVVLNVTVVGPTANGVITAYPDGTAVPTASNLNFLKGENRPNLVTVELGSDGSVDLRNGGNGTSDLVADLEGYYAPGTGTGFSGVENYRSDAVTLTVGKPVPASLFYSGYNGLSTGAAAVAVNITATQGTAAGFVSAYADGGKMPTASNVNYSANENIANMAIVPLGSDGYIDLVAGGKAGATVKVLIDVEGFYTNQPDTYGTGFVPTRPTRLIDTRSGLGLQAKGPTSGTEVDPTKLAGIPAHAAGIAANVTVVDPSANGFFSAVVLYELTATSTLNFAKAQNVANMAELTWAPDGSGQYLYLGTSGATTGIVLDMFGYFVD
ncbi:PKD domain-containing protein [Actinospica durhamensis]|uniref:PKD domain-containing protein n=1 Tax=Actinospica durhamensis TaxID=1508375 RepID=A0A941IKY1_9ACTN|nr:PKD domain-containing protein [Actinospica durhamensis]MBR7832365.1 PKD domain-containing protein [Actinospica durhamensis]